jgi:DNA-binding CsgD family transcriptional regulator
MQNGAISEQARMLAAVSELDASPAPTTEVAAHRLVGVIEALVPSDLSKVWLGGEATFFNVPHMVQGRRIADEPPHSTSVLDHEHLLVTFHDSTGLLTTGRRSGGGGGLRSTRPPIAYRHHDPRLVLTPATRAFWLPFGLDTMLRAPVGFPNEHAHLASYRAAGDFSNADIRLLGQLRPVASRLLRRAAVSSLAFASANAWGLAPREAEVFAFAGVGLSLSSIASILGLSVGTVRTHLGKAYTKSAVRSRAAATSALLDVEPTALHEASRLLVRGEEGPLTRREIAVLRIAATGRTTSAIASVIGITSETAKTHLANVYRKLGVQNRSQALLMAGTAMPSLGGSVRTVDGSRSRRDQTPMRPS